MGEQSPVLDVVVEDVAEKKEYTYFVISKDITIPFTNLSVRTFFTGEKISVEDLPTIEKLIDCGAKGDFV